MRLSFLTLEQMKSVSGPWVTTQRAMLAGIPIVSGLLGELQIVHDGLVVALPGPRVPKAVQEISIEQEEIDLKHHDPLVRGIDSSLEACIHLAATEEESARYALLHKKVLPYGRGLTQKTYTEESGAAELLEERLSDEDKKLLKEIPVIGGSLLERVLDLIKYGKQIGQLENEKVKVLNASNDNAEAPTRAQARLARIQWVRVVGLFLGGLELAKPDAKILSELLGPLEKEDQIAVARQRAKTTKRTESTNPPGKPQ